MRQRNQNLQTHRVNSTFGQIPYPVLITTFRLSIATHFRNMACWEAGLMGNWFNEDDIRNTRFALQAGEGAGRHGWFETEGAGDLGFERLPDETDDERGRGK